MLKWPVNAIRMPLKKLKRVSMVFVWKFKNDFVSFATRMQKELYGAENRKQDESQPTTDKSE